MSADVSHVVGWGFVISAIIVFSIVLRDLLLMRAERVAKHEELERLRAEAHEAEHEQHPSAPC